MNLILRRPALASVALAFIVSGCVSSTPNFDANFGQSVRILQAQQVANPDAPTANADKAPHGLDGQAARDAYDRYQRSFRAPEPRPNVFTIGVSGGSN